MWKPKRRTGQTLDESNVFNGVWSVDHRDLLNSSDTTILEVTPKTEYIVNCVLEDEFPSHMSGATVLALFFYNVEPYHWKKFLMEILHFENLWCYQRFDKEKPTEITKFRVLVPRNWFKIDDGLFGVWWKPNQVFFIGLWVWTNQNQW